MILLRPIHERLRGYQTLQKEAVLYTDPRMGQGLSIRPILLSPSRKQTLNLPLPGHCPAPFSQEVHLNK